MTGEYKASVPCRLLAQGHSWLLEAAHRSSPCDFLNMPAYFIKPERRISRDSPIMQDNVKYKSHPLSPLPYNSDVTYLRIFYWLEEKHTSHPYLKREDYKRHEYQKVGIIGVNRGLCTTQANLIILIPLTVGGLVMMCDPLLANGKQENI